MVLIMTGSVVANDHDHAFDDDDDAIDHDEVDHDHESRW